MSQGALSKRTKGAKGAKIHNFYDKNIIFGKQAQCDKGKQKKKKNIFENFYFLLSLGGEGDFEKGKRDPNEPKVIFLLLKNILFGIFAPGAVPRSSALRLLIHRSKYIQVYISTYRVVIDFNHSSKFVFNTFFFFSSFHSISSFHKSQI